MRLRPVVRFLRVEARVVIYKQLCAHTVRVKGHRLTAHCPALCRHADLTLDSRVGPWLMRSPQDNRWCCSALVMQTMVDMVDDVDEHRWSAPNP